MKPGRKQKDYPASISPSIRDIVFAAAYYEGEGYFGLTPNGNELVSIGQNDREKLDWLQLRFGGKVYGPYEGSIGNNTYHWKLARNRALGFMLTIFTFLSSSRKQQFRLALQGLGSKREYSKWITEDGISLEYLERNINKKVEDKSMNLFGMKKWTKN